jgi:hypothetical protein
MNTWVYGQEGWYCARAGESGEYTRHLRELGYKVLVQKEKPDASA